MKALMAVFFLAMSLPALAFEEPDNFRGIKWGSSPEEAKKIIIDGWKNRGASDELYRVLYRIRPEVGNALLGKGRLREFIFSEMVAGALADFHMWFLDEKFVHAEFTFDSAHFSTMEAAFKERYGQPTVEQTKDVQNRAGASFANRELTWAGKEVHISLRNTTTR